jgi:hypothetical protein
MNYTYTSWLLPVNVLEMSDHSTTLVIVLLPAWHINHSVAFNIYFFKLFVDLCYTWSIRVKGRIVRKHEGWVLSFILQTHSDHIRVGVACLHS